MDLKQFGEIVASLRRERRYFDIGSGKKDYRGWSQELLAEKAGLSLRTIQRIEQGKPVNTPKYVEQLAAAFALSEAEKVPFFAAAGLHYRLPQRDNRWEELVPSIIRGYRYPVHCITPLWDIVALNAYNYALFGHTAQTTAGLQNGPLGANLLQLTFDPAFERKETFGGEAQWREEMLRNLRVFRASALPYLSTTRYKQILSEMYRYPEFARLWDSSLWPPQKDELTHVRPMTTVHHATFGVMTFMTLRIPEGYLGQELYIYSYIPNHESEENFERLRASIGESDADVIHSFNVPPLVWDN